MPACMEHMYGIWGSKLCGDDRPRCRLQTPYKLLAATGQTARHQQPSNDAHTLYFYINYPLTRSRTKLWAARRRCALLSRCSARRPQTRTTTYRTRLNFAYAIKYAFCAARAKVLAVVFSVAFNVCARCSLKMHSNSGIVEYNGS